MARPLSVEQAPLPARSVLIVEDEQIVALDLQQTLQGLGYEALAIAATAEEAILRASERRPDLVLIDIRIKGKRDGIETAAVLRDRFSIPIVFLTAHADPGTVERAKLVEPSGYLVKPVSVAELRSVIELALHKHEIEARLRERERWFATTLRSIGDAILSVDLGGRITFMNPAAEALTGTDARSALGEPVQSVLQRIDRSAAAEAPVLTALREGHLVEPHEGSLRNLVTGVSRTISDSATPVLLDGQVLGAVMVFRDVTEQKKLQKRLELTDRLASLGTMAAGVAHEINNPLAVVLANAMFLAEDLSELGRSNPGDAKRLESMATTIADLRSAADRIGQIASDLRAFSLPAVKTEQTEQTDIRRCIEWAIRATAHEFRHRATLTTDIAALPPVDVDEMRLGQVLINLLINAAHAIPPGAADRNQVTVAARTDAGGRAVIEVRDTGGGISSTVIEHIFEPFFTTKPAGQGSGLGLSICHGLIVAMGGEIQVESEPGKDTVFRVFLPIARQRALSTASPLAQTPPAVRGRVLVIDDEEMILRVLTRILHEQEVQCTASAREALSWLDAGQEFDLILSDLMMPTMTGMQFYEHLLERHAELAPRVVFMTGGVITPNASAFLQSVSNQRLEKPFDCASLVKMVRTRVAEVRARGAGDA